MKAKDYSVPSDINLVSSSESFIMNSNNTSNDKHKIKTQIIECIDNILHNIDFNLKQEIIKKTNQQIDTIQQNFLTTPRMAIIGTIVEHLKYNFEESYIRNMYINLISKEIDTRTHDKVLLAFPDIIKQLSVYDENLIKNLNTISKERKTDRISICFIKERAFQNLNLLNGSVELDILLVDNKGKGENRIVKPDMVSLDNLIRLRIIEINRERYLVKDEDKIRDVFSYYKNEYDTSNPDLELFCEPGILEITNFGRQFIDLCVTDNE